jgi:hypothetical protein
VPDPEIVHLFNQSRRSDVAEHMAVEAAGVILGAALTATL